VKNKATVNQVSVDPSESSMEVSSRFEREPVSSVSIALGTDARTAGAGRRRVGISLYSLFKIWLRNEIIEKKTYLKRMTGLCFASQKIPMGFD
jgi:hypothetical protein